MEAKKPGRKKGEPTETISFRVKAKNYDFLKAKFTQIIEELENRKIKSKK